MSRSDREGFRRAILEASLGLGAEFGEDGVTMRAIAGRLQVSATALYQHFEGKAEILREVRIHGAELLTAEVTGRCAGITEPSARLREMGLAYIDFARARPWLYTVLMQAELLDWSTMTPEEIERTLRPLHTLRAWLREGAEKGAWRADVDPEVTSFRLWAGLHGLCSMLLSGRIDERHPAFPVHNQEEFVSTFVDELVGTLTCVAP